MVHRLIIAVAVLAAVSMAGPEPAPEAGAPAGRAIAAGKAQTVTVEAKMGAGDIVVSIGAAGVLELVCHGPDSGCDQILEYTESRLDPAGAGVYHGHAQVIQLQVGDADVRRCRWDLRLNAELCRELKLTLGAGNATVDLSGSAVEMAYIGLGVGELVLDLSGGVAPGFGVESEVGVGNVHVRVPAGAGIRVETECALGQTEMPERFLMHETGWVSPEWDEAGPEVRLELGAAIGNISVVEERTEDEPVDVEPEVEE